MEGVRSDGNSSHIEPTLLLSLRLLGTHIQNCNTTLKAKGLALPQSPSCAFPPGWHTAAIQASSHTTREHHTRLARQPCDVWHSAKKEKELTTKLLPSTFFKALSHLTVFSLGDLSCERSPALSTLVRSLLLCVTHSSRPHADTPGTAQGGRGQGREDLFRQHGAG